MKPKPILPAGWEGEHLVPALDPDPDDGPDNEEAVSIACSYLRMILLIAFDTDRGLAGVGVRVLALGVLLGIIPTASEAAALAKVPVSTITRAAKRLGKEISETQRRRAIDPQQP